MVAKLTNRATYNPDITPEKKLKAGLDRKLSLKKRLRAEFTVNSLTVLFSYTAFIGILA